MSPIRATQDMRRDAARTARRTRAEPTRISYRVTDFSSPIRAGTVRFPPRGSVTCSGISFTRRNAATRRPRGIDARNGSHASAPTWTAYAPRTTIGPKTKATATPPTPGEVRSKPIASELRDWRHAIEVPRATPTRDAMKLRGCTAWNQVRSEAILLPDRLATG